MGDRLTDPIMDDPARRLALMEERVAGLALRRQAIATSVAACRPMNAVYAPSGSDTVMVVLQASPTSTWIHAWRAEFPTLSAPGLLLSAPWLASTGNEGDMEVRLTAPSGEAASRPSLHFVGIPAGADYAQLAWQHGLALWQDGVHTLDVWMRRTAGASVVGVYRPQVHLCDPRGCTPGAGAWYSAVTGWPPEWL